MEYFMEQKTKTIRQIAHAEKLSRRPIFAFGGGVFLMAFLTSIAGCNPNQVQPLWEAGNSQNKTVFISDIHLGVDDRYTETIRNRPFLVDFLKRLQATSDVRELVIAGDFLDDWYLPAFYPAYTDVVQFYRDCIANNQEVFDELNTIVAKGIKVAYVPGNHDLLLESNVLEEAVPGIIQGRDARGLGVYYAGADEEIAVEHGHRYDVFSAPDTITNAELCGNDDTILPSGYFYARYAATWVLEEKPTNAKTMPEIAKPQREDFASENDYLDQMGAYAYYSVVKTVTEHLTPNEPVEEKIFFMRIAGFNDAYSFLDYYPAKQLDGTISAPVLFPNLQRTWDERQEVNEVKVKNSFIDAAKGTVSPAYFTSQAVTQYLDNPDEDVDIVVFGHTHVPVYKDFGNGKYYLNSGTWVDDNNVVEQAIRTFAVVEGGEDHVCALMKMMDDGTISDITATYTVVDS